jgi:Carboxypeptidase regulatory-like domain/TonB dependent receptor
MKRTLGLLLLIVMCSAGAHAQAVAGSGAVSGTVRDSTGAIVPGAMVVVANDAKGIKRSTLTTEAGIFAVPALVPSSGYSLTVTLQGFKSWETKIFEIQVGQTVDFKVVLEVAGATTEVSVSAEAPLLDTTKGGVAEVVTQEQIDNLPINGRRVDSFVLSTPAVVPDGTFGLISFRGTAMGNAFLTDGNDTTNSFYNENAGRTRISTQISQDAVQEFQVLSNGYSAEFGRAIGGVINTVTRSGGNNVHGTGFWYFRNRTLNATDRYATFNAPEWRHQVGGTIGGPIKQDKLFYFFNTEIVRRNFPAINLVKNTNFSDATGSSVVPSTCTATAAQCAAAISFISKQMNVIVPRYVHSAMGFGKIDWLASERNTFSFDLNAMHWASPNGIQTQAVLTAGNALGNNGNSTVETRYGKASWTRIVSSNAVNEFRFGWFKDRLSDPAASDLWPKETGPLSITISGSQTVDIGAAQAYPRTRPSENRFQFVDNYSWTHGAHSWKVGTDFQTTYDWINQLFNANARFAYSSLTNFARDFSDNTTGAKNYQTFTQAFGNPVHAFRTSDINFYFQDTWKFTPRFTMSYGLRYEKAWLPQPAKSDANYAQTGVIPQDNNNFAPRFSLSYSLKDKTVLRAGYGIFYARIHGNLLDTLFLGNNTTQSNVSINNTQTGAPVFPIVFPDLASVPPGTGGAISLQFAARNFYAPYTQQGTIAVERRLTRDLGLTVSYLWSRGVGLIVQRDLNLGPQGPPVTYQIKDAAGNIASSYTTPTYLFANRVDTRYSKILQVENGGNSWYNGLAVQLNKRMSHGITTKLSYTWAHAIEDGNEQGASWNIDSTFNNATFNGNYRFDRGSSTLDQRHRAVINWVWTPTFTKSNSILARYFINGWGISGIATIASASPVTPTITFSGSTSSQFSGVNLAFTTLNGSGGWNRVPFLPVGSVDVDRVHRVDARLERQLPFGERVKARLIFEGFNVFNMMYNTSISTQAYTAAGGVLTPNASLGQGTASQGFPDGTNARRAQVAFRLTF